MEVNGEIAGMRTDNPESMSFDERDFRRNANGAPCPPIAIVGIGCRFPGGVTGPKSFWRLLRDGVDAIAEIPSDRIDIGTYYDPRPALPGKMSTRWGGFLDQIEMFDAAFFGISPREADRLDPQQRVLLEVAWEALEDAGQPSERLAGSLTGVFVGLWLNDYEARLFADPAAVDFYMTTGTGRYSASGRLSYVLGLEGPSLTIDTACSSSLVAVHLACQSLRRNECSLALAGGANIILQPHISIAYSQSRMMAPDGRCKFGDARANGYVRSEGAGIVVLKPLAEALTDGDPIYAVIRGSAINNDGRTSGYMTTPSRTGQERMLRLAYRDAGLSPCQVGYVEAHGTGTIAGDPVELTALGNVLSPDRPPERPCYIGSVKTNFGHTEGAAGIAGLIKTALVLKHRMVPANLHLRELNPAIAWNDYPLVMPRELTHLVQDSAPAVAGVSAFGIAGTNAHAVLTEAPRREHAREDAQPYADRACVLTLSARSPQALTSLARAYVSALEEEGGPSLYDVCYTGALRRTHHEHRLAVTAGNRAGVGEHLRAFLRGESVSWVWTGKTEPESKPKVVFVCPGQGSQWVGMGRQLLREEAVFREWLQRCEHALRPYVDWSLQEQLHLNPGTQGYRLNEIDVIQPVLFSIQVALAALWRSWGVQPDAVVGHSMGESAAAFVSQALSLEDAARVICTRAMLLRRISGKGAMAMVALTVDQARECLAGFEDRVSVAVSNSPRSTVLSGDPSAMQEIIEKLQAREVFCRPVKVDVASHSPQVDVLTNDLLRELSTIQPRETKVPMYSTVAAERIEGHLLDARYWVRNLRSPVLFSRAVQMLADDGHTIFIELSPHPVLTAAIEETVTGAGRKVTAIPSMEREKDEQLTLRNSVGRLYTIGYSIDWAELFPFRGKVVPLPLYPWQRQRFWLQSEPREPKNGGASFRPTAGQNHPLLGIRLPEVASLAGSIVWQNETGEGSSPPSETACIDMTVAAATEAFGPNLHRISDLTADMTPGLAANSGVRTQFILNTGRPNPASFQLFCQGSEPSAEWTKYASGKIEPRQAKADWIYELVWKEKALDHSTSEAPAGRWLIFADRGGIGAAAAAAMTSRGQDCVLVFAGESFEVQGPARFCAAPQKPDHIRQLFGLLAEDGKPSCRGIVYFWGLDSLTAGCDGALSLIQSLARTEWNTAPRLWVATAGAQAVEPMDGESLSLEQAPLWGLGRVIALEQPNVWGGLIDLPLIGNPTAANAGIAELCDELLASDGEDQVALRGNRRYVLRLERSRLAAVSKPFALSPRATYLITGGLGSLGLHVARWLIAQGARHLVLTGRTGLPERSTWPSIPAETEIGKRVAALRALEESGATIHIAKADAAHRQEMSELWNKLDSEHPPVRGIVHAAGILRPRELVDLESNEFHAVLRPKMDGASLLHELVQATNCRANALDFFVLFSSGASVWGSQSMAHYAAANHFIDALAQHRVALGLPALSVNWGWWEGAGMVSEELAARFRSIGMKGLPADGALEALTYLLETGAAQKTVADMDWSVFRPIFEARRKRPLLESLEALPKETEQVKAREEKRHGPLQEIEQASAIERKPLLHDYIRTQVAEILGFRSPDRVDPRQGFFRMGMDSIMTVQLRNRLETALGLSLPPTVAFEYPTVDSLVDFIAGLILKPEASAIHPAHVPEKQELSNVNTGCEQLSEEELVALLERRLEQIR
jgi:acyl transferase domain-containing protein/acyl carrier protein